MVLQSNMYLPGSWLNSYRLRFCTSYITLLSNNDLEYGPNHKYSTWQGNYNEETCYSLVSQTMALPVARGGGSGDVHPHRGIRAGGPPVVPHRGRHLRRTWGKTDREVSQGGPLHSRRATVKGKRVSVDRFKRTIGAWKYTKLKYK